MDPKKAKRCVHVLPSCFETSHPLVIRPPCLLLLSLAVERTECSQTESQQDDRGGGNRNI
jgi:hypothetical protein